ncbi:hypothetical protein [Kitasatospora azatica]|uniref:hypothetical protein n=1 Tax=Kitasatospora azatica TaxID=58347 RepID=UPI000566FA96|nr:hypothetical protein [Kitasatospora azatica]
MDLPIPSGSRLRTAAYLRCYPHDTWQMSVHCRALTHFARQLGLPEPDVYLDNGFPSGAPLPQREQLLRLVASKTYQVVLVPGAFVFSLHDVVARDVVRRITAQRCRVLELPAERRKIGSPATGH